MRRHSPKALWVMSLLLAALHGCASDGVPEPRGRHMSGDLAAFAMAAPFVADTERPRPASVPADIVALLERRKVKGETDHLGLLVEYGLRVHWNCLKHTGLARKLPVESNMMLSELVRIGQIPRYTTAHEAGWLNSQFHGPFDQTGWSSYQVYIWVKERIPAIGSDQKRFPNAKRIAELMRTIDSSPLNGVGGGGVCHYGCI